MMDSFVLLVYASLAASRTLLQLLLACLDFRFRRFILLVQMKKKKKFYELWQQHKPFKTWRWVRLDLILMMRDTYTSSNLNSLTKFTSRSRSAELKISSHRIYLKWSWRPFQSVQEYLKLCNKMGHPVVNLMESQRKMRQPHVQNVTMEEKPL